MSYTVGYGPLALILACACAAAAAQTPAPSQAPVDLANGLVGTAPLDQQNLIGNAPPPGELLYSGFTSPGAELPHSSTDVSPINVNLRFTYPAGPRSPYFYPALTMLGFSSGGRYGPTIEPVVGNFTIPPQRTPSLYDKATETSSPGYYAVDLTTFKTRAEMTATTWTALYRFTFPQTDRARVLLDLGRRGGHVDVVGDDMIRGQANAGDHHAEDIPGNTWFVAEFSEPFAAFGTFRQIPPKPGDLEWSLLGDKDVQRNRRAIAGPYAGSYVTFATHAGEQVLVKVAHGHSYADALARLKAEDPGWDFDAIHAAARNTWARQLDKIEVTGGTAKERMLFYSSLEHALVSPRLLARKGEPFTDTRGQTEVATYDRYGPVPLWDTGRDQIVLLMLLEPKLTRDILQSELDLARETGYMETSFHGDNAVFLYLGAWERGIAFDWPAAYKYLYKNATDPAGPRPYLAEYVKNGWIADVIPQGNPDPPYAGGKAGVATTLEYGWDDHALAEYARRLGKTADAAMFLKRAHDYQNLFDPSIGFMRGRTANGKWISPFDPEEPYYNFMMKEGSGWAYLWLVPYDVQGLVNLLGGRAAFDAKLDAFFTTPYHPKGICRDCTGLIGQYVQGNQPDWEVPYYYDWGGEPWKTQAVVRKILRLLFGSDKSGYAYAGMDDNGSLAAWYVFSAMGFYPVDPSSPDYALGSPIFNDVKMRLGNGKVFEIEARNNSDRNVYIQSATLNGKPWNRPWFSQSDIAEGGKLVLTMGPAPNPAWGSAPDAAPPSMSGPAHRHQASARP
ncbi:MAG TPA: GH92 family glycosyl hydrolase [Rhodanobacteraceae bacterium]|nr:GH92 family glycosyl hydrolase [Rhodanobacteraceae bacterium]